MIYQEDTQQFELDDNEILEKIKQLPLYKSRGKEKIFLGILKSKTKNWIGWQFIAKQNFKLQDDIDLLYELAINFYKINPKYFNQNLLKLYDF